MADSEKSSHEWRVEGEEILRTIKTPGFEILCRLIKAQADANLSNMKNAKSEFEMVKLHAAYIAMSSFEEFAKSTARTLLAPSVAGS